MGDAVHNKAGKNNVPWSYSSLSLFKLCPKKYYHERVAKDIPFEETEALRYGNEVHAAIERYLKGGELDPKYEHFRDTVDATWPSGPDVSVFVERKIGYTREFKPCDFFDAEVWFRGKIDLLVVDNDHAWLLDWKTGRNARFADTTELELFAIGVFNAFEQVHKIKAAFVYLVSGDFIERGYDRDSLPNLLMKHLPEVDRMEKAHQLNVWNPSPNFTCKNYCKVESCPHYRR